MAPPKFKLHNNTGKLQSIPRPRTIPSAENGFSVGDAPEASPSEADRQFEVELYWCIQQLESSLNLPNVRENNKKVEETSKLINKLKSDSQPIIRKRQIMRSTFGDYRSKMASEEQTLTVNPDNVRFEKPKEKTPKYHFVKKSAISIGENNFKFNFPVNVSNSENAGAVNASSAEKHVEVQIMHTNANKIVPTGNLFRFNFNIE
ncbi:UPF0488 protein CG14286 [Anopheles marshallii]|uniref:UPF0488 protein CG14286 n=1 Tax=Anopheles marshallii TaxID=1521116 RepID=UPI00237B8060|nr:UPF0488 protein CG14286 [Anopheles marshallii]